MRSCTQLRYWKFCLALFLSTAATIISPAQTFTTLTAFNWSDGAHPEYAPLVQGLDGNFYGATVLGGANGFGTVFKVTPSGAVTTLYSFCYHANCAGGAEPLAGLVLATSGNFYGTTQIGGADDEGTVFEITPKGKLTQLYSFCAQSGCTDGWDATAGLIQATDGNFYGTTVGGGANGFGTIFKITPSGALTTLHSFIGSDGDGPVAGLIQANDRNFYGTTFSGGLHGFGTVFKLTVSGALTTLYDFCDQGDCTDGYGPNAGLVQATSGTFFGITYFGGNFLNSNCVHDSGCGTVFSLDVGLGPFVEALPYSGKAGRNIKILGQGLTGATAVSFNGNSASFTVNSDTYLTATVPSSATTGFVTVTTPGGLLKSNQQFRVIR